MYDENWTKPNWKTLIADDHYAICEFLTRLSTKYIGESIACQDGHDALKLFNEAFESDSPYKLILLDIEMPHIEGTDVVNQIREKEIETGIPEADRVKIVLVTGYPDEEHIKEWFTTGFNEYLVKPISKKSLLQTIQSMR
jgi:CheY-like chemotaxis protein